MSQLYSVTIEEITRLCSYIPDDKKVAYHLGIDPHRVKRVRARMPKGESGPNPDYKCGKDSSGLEEQRKLTSNARWASAEMKERLEDFFAKWERRHGFRKDAGRLLVPAGYSPQRQKVAA